MKEERQASKRYERTGLLLGANGMKKLRSAHVAVFGVGGVGGYAVEALARAGVGTFTLVDSDTVSESNINRQIIALTSTVGKYKVDVFGDRIHDIDPDTVVNLYKTFVLPENVGMFDFPSFDYIVDAVDTVTAKIALITAARDAGVPIISSMGTGNKLDPSRLEIADISKTSVCPLARVMRIELRKRGIKNLKVVYSKEEPQKVFAPPEKGEKRRAIPGSVSFVPPAAGLLIASEVVKDLLKWP